MTTPPPYPPDPDPGNQFPAMPPYGSGGSPPPPSRNSMAIAALVLGILSVPLGVFGLLGLVLGVLAIIFGAIGLARANRGAPRKRMATFGLALGVIGVIIAAVFIYLGVRQLHRCEDKIGHRPNSAELRQCARDHV